MCRAALTKASRAFGAGTGWGAHPAVASVPGNMEKYEMPAHDVYLLICLGRPIYTACARVLVMRLVITITEKCKIFIHNIYEDGLLSYIHQVL